MCVLKAKTGDVVLTVVASDQKTILFVVDIRLVGFTECFSLPGSFGSRCLK